LPIHDHRQLSLETYLRNYSRSFIWPDEVTSTGIGQSQITTTPEQTSLMLMGIGVAALAIFDRKRAAASQSQTALFAERTR
jgi:hypothetical protein